MKRRVIALMICQALMAGMLAGCSTGSSDVSDEPASGTETVTEEEVNEEESVEESDLEEVQETSAALDISDQAEIVMYIISDRPAGQDVVDENLNEILLERLNCTLQINWISWSDYANKYPLLFSSGEEFDLVYTASWLNWTQLAEKGAFMELDDLWPTYAPDNYALATTEAITEVTLNDHIYIIPCTQSGYFSYGPTYRTVFEDGLEYTGEITDMESVETYLDWVVENEPDIQPYDVYSSGSVMDDMWMFNNGYHSTTGADNDFLFFDVYADSPELITYWEYEDVDEFLEMMNRWNEKGFFSKSALADTDTTKITTGLAALRMHNYGTYVSCYLTQPDWGFQYTNIVEPVSHSSYTQNAVAISNTSKNPERAMALWNLITTDQEVFDAFYYGVEGVTYELNDAGEYTILDSDLYSTSAMWTAQTNELTRMVTGTPDDYEDLLESLEESVQEDNAREKYMSFKIDTSEIETEYAACQSVQQQYWWPLELGYTDPVEGLAQYQEKMEAAGIETVRAEIQRQLDEYVESLGE